MAETSKPAAGKDVAEPGSTPPDATSKPVIVGHSAQIADPMVSAAAAPQPDEKPAPPAAPTTSMGSSKPKLMPSSGAQDAQAAADKEENAEAEADTAEAKEEQEHQARLQELIESGEYNVSIGQKANKNSARTFIFTVLAIVLAGVIALYILTDLKVVDLGIKVPFHIFGKEDAPVETVVTPEKAGPKTYKLVNSGITFTYDPNLWLLKQGTSNTKTNILDDLMYKTAQNGSFISLSESVDDQAAAAAARASSSCTTTKTCAKDILEYHSVKLDKIKKRDLYYYWYIKQSVATKKTNYYLLAGISGAATAADRNDPVKSGTAVTVGTNQVSFSATAFVYKQAPSTVFFDSQDEAVAYTTSTWFKDMTTVLQSATDQ